MFTETQLKAKELKLDINSIVDCVNPRYKNVACSVAKKAESIVNFADMRGHALEDELVTLEDIKAKVMRMRMYS